MRDKDAYFLDDKVLEALNFDDNMKAKVVGTQVITIGKNPTYPLWLSESAIKALSEKEINSLRPAIICKKVKIVQPKMQDRNLYLFHYLNWPDRTEVPDVSLLNTMLDRVEVLSLYSNVPVAINCRAGVSRTCAVALSFAARLYVRYSMQKQNFETISLNLPAILYKMRRDRPGLVSRKALKPTYKTVLAYIKRAVSWVENWKRHTLQYNSHTYNDPHIFYLRSSQMTSQSAGSVSSSSFSKC